MFKMRKAGLYSFIFLAAFAFCLWFYLYTNAPQGAGLLKVAFLSVGQGDSIYIEAPNGRQMLIDGGPRGSLIKPLASVMPVGDTSIDVVLLTHPDADHYAGLVDLVKSYSIGTVIESGKTSNAKTYLELESLISDKQIPKIIARAGTRVDLDAAQGIVFTVLFPNGDVSKIPTNDASIVGRLVYKEDSVMFTGDAPIKTENYLLSAYKTEDLQSEILKVGHHGSRTSTSEAFLRAVQPTIAIISAGKDNKYGHPHQETLKKLAIFGIQPLVTKDKGTITFLSDGKAWKQATK